MTITLKALLVSLAGKPKPKYSQAVWIVDCPDPENDNFSEAIANSVCELEDKLRCDRSGFFFSTTAILFSLLQDFTPDEVEQDWLRVILHLQQNLIDLNGT